MFKNISNIDFDAEDLKFDFGCGQNKEKGFVGVDIQEHKGVDIIADFKDFNEIPDNCASVISSCHFIEHFTIREQHQIMTDWVRILRPSGTLVCHFPDIGKVNPSLDAKWALQYVYGAMKNKYDCHKSFNTSESMAILFDTFGLKNNKCEDYMGRLHFSKTINRFEDRVWTTTITGINNV